MVLLTQLVDPALVTVFFIFLGEPLLGLASPRNPTEVTPLPEKGVG